MADKGWIKLHRCIRKNILWPEKQRRSFTHMEAWIDLLLEANHEPVYVPIDMKKVFVDRGQTLTSEIKLAERWKWSRNKVRRFLDKLENIEKNVTKNSTTKYTILTIVNYGFYQDGDTTNDTTNETTRDTTGEHQKDNRRNTNKNDKNDKELKNDKNTGIPYKNNYAEFVSMTSEEYQKLVDDHGEPAVKRMIQILDNYKGANGRKYKSDYRAILNWVVKRYQEEQQRPYPNKMTSNQATELWDQMTEGMIE